MRKPFVAKQALASGARSRQRSEKAAESHANEYMITGAPPNTQKNCVILAAMQRVFLLQDLAKRAQITGHSSV